MPRNLKLKLLALKKGETFSSKLKFKRIRLKFRVRRRTRRMNKRIREFRRYSKFKDIKPQPTSLLPVFTSRRLRYNKYLRKSLWTFSRRKSKKKKLIKKLISPLYLKVDNSYLQNLFSTEKSVYQRSSSQSENYNFLKSVVHKFHTVPLNHLFQFWANPFIVKYFFLRPSILQTTSGSCVLPSRIELETKALIRNIQNQLRSYSFNTLTSRLPSSNIWAFTASHYLLQKKLLRSISQMVFRADIGTWSQRCVIQFLENVSGRKIAINVGPFVDHILTIEDHARSWLWDNRSSGFKKLLGHRIFTSEAVMLVTAALRLKDPTLLSNWIRGMLQRMSFWKYRVLFRYLKFLIQHLFRFKFSEFGFKGFKLRLKGKISVGGNSRSRVLFYRVGDTSHSKTANKVAYDLSYINTFTGVLGFKLWFFY